MTHNTNTDDDFDAITRSMFTAPAGPLDRTVPAYVSITMNIQDDAGLTLREPVPWIDLWGHSKGVRPGAGLFTIDGHQPAFARVVFKATGYFLFCSAGTLLSQYPVPRPKRGDR